MFRDIGGDKIRELLDAKKAIDEYRQSQKASTQYKPASEYESEGECPPGYKRWSNINTDNKTVFGKPPTSTCVPESFNPATSTISFPGGR